MSIELRQAAEQSLDLSTPTLREMVTRHAAVIDSRATLEDMPEALAFQIDMARALLREFAAIQQTETQQPATTEPVAWMHPSGGVLQALLTGIERNTYTIPLYTHPAPSAPGDVVRNAERYRWLRDHDHWPAPFSSSQEPEPVRGRDLDAAIDAMLAAK